MTFVDHPLKRFSDHVYCTETRPYNQGARLTAYELVHEKIPSTLIVDSVVSALMNSRRISAVVVGADRVSILLVNQGFIRFFHHSDKIDSQLFYASP